MTQTAFLQTIEEIIDYLESAFDGDARALGISPDRAVRGAEILRAALTVCEWRYCERLWRRMSEEEAAA